MREIYQELKPREDSLAYTTALSLLQTMEQKGLVGHESAGKAYAYYAEVKRDGVYRKQGPARVFTREHDAIAAIKGQGAVPIRAGDVIVLMGRGPLGAGMEEIYQVTSSLKHLQFGKEVAVVTDARFSGVSTGACIGHVSPEALAGGPLGKVRDGDLIRIVIDRKNLEGTVDMIGAEGKDVGPEQGARILEARDAHPRLSPDPDLPDDVRLWAALQEVSGGVWGGCVYDVQAVIAKLAAGKDRSSRAEPADDPGREA